MSMAQPSALSVSTIPEVTTAFAQSAPVTAAAGEIVHHLAFFDLTETITNAEPIKRSIWREICLERNAIFDGRDFWAKDLGKLVHFGTKEALFGSLGHAMPIIDWDDEWEKEGGWYGIGDAALYEDLAQRHFLPKGKGRVIQDLIRRRTEDAIRGRMIGIRPGIVDAFNAMSRYNRLLGIGTNDPADLVDMQLKSFDQSDNGQFASLLRFVVTPEDVGGHTKPAPDIYLECMARSRKIVGSGRCDIVIVADAPADIVSAAAAAEQFRAEGNVVRIAHYPYADTMPKHPLADVKIVEGTAARDLSNLMKPLKTADIRPVP